jgi:hypothetical protein
MVELVSGDPLHRSGYKPLAMDTDSLEFSALERYVNGVESDLAVIGRLWVA